MMWGERVRGGVALVVWAWREWGCACRLGWTLGVLCGVSPKIKPLALWYKIKRHQKKPRSMVRVQKRSGDSL